MSALFLSLCSCFLNKSGGARLIRKPSSSCGEEESFLCREMRSDLHLYAVSSLIVLLQILFAVEAHAAPLANILSPLTRIGHFFHFSPLGFASHVRDAI